jgi:hypothetical protein
MKAKVLLASSVIALGLSQISYAETIATYTNVSPNDGPGGPGYSANVAPPPPPEHTYEREHHGHDRDHARFSFGFGIDDSHIAYSTDSAYTSVEVIGRRYHHHRTPLQWVDMMRGQPLPQGAVIGGNAPTPPYHQFVCRGEYEDGVHPGKVSAGFCNISWGGEEVSLPNYQVLVSKVPLGWVPADYGQIPMNAVAGGYERDETLYICKARYHGNFHTGKVIGQNCNFGWNGREIAIPHYQVLTM